jgi:hypothetical protein
MTETAQIEEALSVRAQKEQPLYAGRVQVYPKSVAGIFRRLKWAVLVALLGLYYVLPWIRWDRGPDQPDQAVLADIEGQRLYFFFIEIWPQEIYYLAGLLILGAVGLFLVTSLAGRVWCGYACPQTVWTDLYMWVERLIQGDRNARIKLDKAPFGANKVLRKTLTHAVWLVIAAATGGIWIMYFNDAPTVVRDIFTGQASLTVYGFTGLFTGTTYLLAGWAREQVCTYMCPWPRFQAAMFDEDSLIVTYQGWRGEPRGRLQSLRRGLSDRHRYPRRQPDGVHRLRTLHRCLQQRHGQGRPARRVDHLRHRPQSAEPGRREGAELPPGAAAYRALQRALRGGRRAHALEPADPTEPRHHGVARPQPALRRAFGRQRPQQLHHQAAQHDPRAARLHVASGGTRRGRHAGSGI